MRIIGPDIHRAFTEAVAWDDGKLRRLGRVGMRLDLLTAFARQLWSEDVVSSGAARSRAARLRARPARPARLGPLPRTGRCAGRTGGALRNPDWNVFVCGLGSGTHMEVAT